MSPVNYPSNCESSKLIEEFVIFLVSITRFFSRNIENVEGAKSSRFFWATYSCLIILYTRYLYLCLCYTIFFLLFMY